MCRAPCDVWLEVEDREARVTAPGMTTSNVFRIEPGMGRAAIRVNGGSSSARTWGIVTLATGIPLALTGAALLAKGKQGSDDGLQAAGIGGLALGGASVVISLPLLLLGSTKVQNAKGSVIAWRAPSLDQ